MTDIAAGPQRFERGNVGIDAQARRSRSIR
jgi:hypothetical protein